MKSQQHCFWLIFFNSIIKTLRKLKWIVLNFDVYRENGISVTENSVNAIISQGFLFEIIPAAKKTLSKRYMGQLFEKIPFFHFAEV